MKKYEVKYRYTVYENCIVNAEDEHDAMKKASEILVLSGLGKSILESVQEIK